ncbi:putative esterase [Actinacidiphila reveromycinica]|uniref:Putative esterase n=1 Tax=Actinacidiphila reveromycinica TaxID=659352 RepID=A0A7U3UMY6_9ACTN|nr:putative esterase [Streptomyces sp. SN-593]
MLVALSLTAALGVALLPGSADARAKAPEALGATVTHTKKGPTGYEVTFRIKDASATSMRIKGAWSFASTASSSTDPTNAAPIPAAQWQPGDFALQSPDMPSENWPVADMTEDARTGIWSYTVPLPSGTFDYQFYPDCTAAAPALSGCTAETDPTVPAWSSAAGASPAVFSQVYVPSDAKFGTTDSSLQADAPKGEQGRITDVSYPTANTSTGTHPLAVYTPAGYDPKRSTPYPVFVLSHGGGENEAAWPTRGRLQQIVDNLVAQGRMQPAIVVMPDGSGLTKGTVYTQEITDNVLPYVEKHYDVSTSASGRAFAGTSAYGTQANNFLFQQTTEFGYVGAWSPASGAPAVTVTGSGNTPVDPAYTNPQLKQVLGIHLAIGQEDLGGNAPMMTATTEREGMINAGVPFTYYSTGGGHTWTFWQSALADFLTRTGFRTTSTAATAGTTSLTATVTASTAEPAAPTGTVQFKVDGADLGKPVAVRNGKATLSARTAAGATVTAVYSGDRYYNASTSAAASRL